MSHQEIQKAARKKIKLKKAFYILTVIFSLVSIFLLSAVAFIIWEYRPPLGEFAWILSPIPFFVLTLGIIYLAAFGFPGSTVMTSEWEEEQMKLEMQRQYRKRGLVPPAEDKLSEEDRLELQVLERLKQKWEGQDELV